MSIHIEGEMLLFLKAAGMGVFFYLLHDVLAGFRQALPHTSPAAGAEEILFWLCGAGGFFLLIDIANSGVLRGFLFLGMLIGIWLYDTLLHRWCQKLFGKLWMIPIKIVKKFINGLLFAEKQCKIFVYKYTRSKKGENRFR